MAEPPLPGRFASPACQAGEIAPDYFDPLAVDPEQARDVARWRKAERTARLAARAALSVSERQELAARVGDHVAALVRERFPEPRGLILAGYWPIKSELDLRPALTRLMEESGLRLAMPVVSTPKAPLTFRPWAPGARMERGFWNIPVPATLELVKPDIVLAPVLGFDGAGYRLGYGGGYFDRTLGQPGPRPYAIGIALESQRLATIFPQPHDIRLDVIVTENGPQRSAK